MQQKITNNYKTACLPLFNMVQKAGEREDLRKMKEREKLCLTIGFETAIIKKLVAE